jgi:hypothetical protein
MEDKTNIEKIIEEFDNRFPEVFEIIRELKNLPLNELNGSLRDFITKAYQAGIQDGQREMKVEVLKMIREQVTYRNGKFELENSMFSDHSERLRGGNGSESVDLINRYNLYYRLLPMVTGVASGKNAEDVEKMVDELILSSKE